MTVQHFGDMPDGCAVQAITLAAHGLRLRVLTLGAILADLRLEGVGWPLVLGSAEIGAYLGPMAWFGAVVGPVANRISGARAEIDGRVAHFEANEGPNCLHGGFSGTSAQVWRIATVAPDRVELSLDLPAGLGGFAGNRRLAAEYRITTPATVELKITASTDAPTLMNPAHHPYWNLDGDGDTSGHWLKVAAEAYLPTTPQGLPTGAIQSLKDDKRDLRHGRTLGGVPMLDHCYVLAGQSRALSHVAELRGRRGVSLYLATTAPGLQVYDGCALDTRPWVGHTGAAYSARAGLALEPQLWPDAPANPGFPSIVLHPGAAFRQLTRYRLGRTAPT